MQPCRMQQGRRLGRVLSLAVFLSLALSAGSAMALNVTTTNDGSVLVNTILGSGFTIDASSIVYQGANTDASGTFVNGGSVATGIGFDSGILLTTGYAAGAEGSNEYGNYNNYDNYSGPGTVTSLKFQFTSTGGDLFFNYVFASEEYTDSGDYEHNDFFKFLVDGVNIAVLPGVTEISASNINASANSAYFRNNVSGQYITEYDGLTTVLMAQYLGLSAGTHTVEIIISDVGDDSSDSGVFIQAGTFSDSPTPINAVPAPAAILLLGGGLTLVEAHRQRKKA